MKNVTKILKKLIYEIRGVQVMLNYDLAKSHECTNGTKAVNRNIERFLKDFYFQLTK